MLDGAPGRKQLRMFEATLTVIARETERLFGKEEFQREMRKFLRSNKLS
jgi:hypothetical protein